MADKHETILEIRADASNAKAEIAQVQAALDALHTSAARLNLGGGGGGGGAGGGGFVGGGPGGGGAGPGGGGGGAGNIQMQSQAFDDYYVQRQKIDSQVESDRQADRLQRDEQRAQRERTQSDAQFRGRVRDRTQMLGAGPLAGATAAMALSPNFVTAGIGTALMAGQRGLSRRLEASSSRFLQGTGAALGSLPIVGAGLAGTALAVNRRFQRFLRFGRLQQQRNLAARGAFRGSTMDAVNAGADMGLMPEEAMGVVTQGSLAAGRTGGLSARDIINFSRTGASLGSQMGLFSQGVVGGGFIRQGGGGVTANNLREIVAGAQSQGLAGANVDRFLGMIASNTGKLASQGLTLDPRSMQDFFRIINRDGRGVRGLDLPRALANVTGDVAGAKQGIFGQFANLGQSALMAEAFSTGGDLAGAGSVLEDLAANPGYANEAVNNFLGPELAAFTRFGQGMSASDANAMTGSNTFGNAVLRGGRRRFRPSAGMQVAPPSTTQQLIARQDADRIAAATGQNATQQLQATLDAIHSLETAMDTLAGGIMSLTSRIINLLSDRRLKKDISETCDHPYNQIGLKAYTWSWNDTAFECYGLSGTSQGVIAQEVAAIMPSAVRVDNNGYYMVLYPVIDSLVDWSDYDGA